MLPPSGNSSRKTAESWRDFKKQYRKYTYFLQKRKKIYTRGNSLLRTLAMVAQLDTSCSVFSLGV